MMNASEASQELESIARNGCAISDLYAFTERAESVGAALDVVDAILRFLEQHDDLDTGAPGPLVHFAEDFYQKGYEDLLVRSLQKKPTSKTLEMLNRLINGTVEPSTRARYVAVCEAAFQAPNASPKARAEAAHYLERYRKNPKGT